MRPLPKVCDSRRGSVGRHINPDACVDVVGYIALSSVSFRCHWGELAGMSTRKTSPDLSC